MDRTLFHIKDRPDASPYRASDRVELETHPYEIVDSERAPFLQRRCGTVELLFPKGYLQDGASVQSMQRRYYADLSQRPSPQFPSPAQQAASASQFVYCTYSLRRAQGCEHYASHFTFHCKKCEEEGLPPDHACKRCHDDSVYTHELRPDTVSWVSCVECGATYPFDDAFSGCPECGEETRPSYICSKCLIISDTLGPRNPAHHCEGCGHCIRGDRACTMHCDKCHRCYSYAEYASHNCIPQVGACTFCLDPLDSSTAPYLLLGCNSHYAHEHCLSAYLTSGKATNRASLTAICPVCRKNLFRAPVCVHHEKPGGVAQRESQTAAGPPICASAAPISCSSEEK